MIPIIPVGNGHRVSTRYGYAVHFSDSGVENLWISPSKWSLTMPTPEPTEPMLRLEKAIARTKAKMAELEAPFTFPDDCCPMCACGDTWLSLHTKLFSEPHAGELLRLNDRCFLLTGAERRRFRRLWYRSGPWLRYHTMYGANMVFNYCFPNPRERLATDPTNGKPKMPEQERRKAVAKLKGSIRAHVLAALANEEKVPCSHALGDSIRKHIAALGGA